MEKYKTTFRPILFSTPMVQAILEGRKTMTRRTKGLEYINTTPNNFRYDGINDEDDDYKGCHFFEYINTKYPPETFAFVEPVMNVGDVLWVRETFKYIDFAGENNGYVYKASENGQDWQNNCEEWKWKPSIFMPKHACRIFLKVKAIRAERLQDISEKDIKNEGVQVRVNNLGKALFELGENHGPIFFAKNMSAMSSHEVWLTHWAALWCKINGMQSWVSNPYVWVYEFERIEKPLDFI